MQQAITMIAGSQKELGVKPRGWSSIGYHVQRDNQDGLLSVDFGLAEFGPSEMRSAVTSELHGVNDKIVEQRLNHYRRFLYEKGTAGSQRSEVGDRKSHHRQRGKIDDNVVEVERERGFKLNEYDKFRYRTRYFIDSGIIGSREFVDPPASPELTLLEGCAVT